MVKCVEGCGREAHPGLQRCWECRTVMYERYPEGMSPHEFAVGEVRRLREALERVERLLTASLGEGRVYVGDVAQAREHAAAKLWEHREAGGYDVW